MAKLPVSRGQMLRVLTGTQKGWFGKLRLPEDFLDALGAAFQTHRHGSGETSYDFAGEDPIHSPSP
jgi:hypothetical protein